MIYFCKLHFFPSQEHSRDVPISNYFYSLSCKAWIYLKKLISQIVILLSHDHSRVIRTSNQVRRERNVNNVFSQNIFFLNDLFLQIALFSMVGAQSCRSHQLLISLLILQKMNFLNHLILQIAIFFYHKSTVSLFVPATRFVVKNVSIMFLHKT